MLSENKYKHLLYIVVLELMVDAVVFPVYLYTVALPNEEILRLRHTFTPKTTFSVEQ